MILYVRVGILLRWLGLALLGGLSGIGAYISCDRDMNQVCHKHLQTQLVSRVQLKPGSQINEPEVEYRLSFRYKTTGDEFISSTIELKDKYALSAINAGEAFTLKNIGAFKSLSAEYSSKEGMVLVPIELPSDKALALSPGMNLRFVTPAALPAKDKNSGELPAKGKSTSEPNECKSLKSSAKLLATYTKPSVTTSLGERTTLLLQVTEPVAQCLVSIDQANLVIIMEPL